jgi:hypothetical protein
MPQIWTPRFLITAILGAALVGVLTAIPTAIIDNPWFTRMTPVYADQYVFWIGTAVLTGALLATYFGGLGVDRAAGAGAAGGALGYLAFGCPICNKLIVALLGVTGAMDYFAPVQPFLGGLGLIAAGAALSYRLRALRRTTCEVQPA